MGEGGEHAPEYHASEHLDSDNASPHVLSSSVSQGLDGHGMALEGPRKPIDSASFSSGLRNGAAASSMDYRQYLAELERYRTNSSDVLQQLNLSQESVESSHEAQSRPPSHGKRAAFDWNDYKQPTEYADDDSQACVKWMSKMTPWMRARQPHLTPEEIEQHLEWYSGLTPAHHITLRAPSHWP